MLAENPGTRIRIVGVNEHGFSGGNALISDMAKSIPWLQDTPAVDMWTRWDVVYRDVIVVDERNRRVFVSNTDEYPVEVPDNLAALRAQLLEVAGESSD